MTTCLNGEEIAKKIGDVFPEAVTDTAESTIVVDSQHLYKVAEYLKNTDIYSFDYLTNITSVDYIDYFEIIYTLVSLKHNHSLVLKARLYDREKPTAPSVVSLWRTADYQEREIYDLMGISFDGHPNLKRLFLWDGFPGHPLRRDYL